MPTVTITVSEAIAQELNEMAQEAGYSNAKMMALAYLRDRYVVWRRRAASEEAGGIAQEEAEEGIT